MDNGRGRSEDGASETDQAVGTQAVDGRIAACPVCKLPLPLRHPRAGEAASVWLCSYCCERFLAVLDDTCPATVLANVNPAEDVNPRATVAGVTVGHMYKRTAGKGRVLEQRRADRHLCSQEVTITLDGQELEVVTVDLSSGGFSFLTEQPLSKDTEVLAKFHHPPWTPPTRCAVRSCTAAEHGGYRIGVAFMD